MKKIYLIIFLFLGQACANSQILLKDLVVKDNCFYEDSLKVYSGYVFSKFGNGKVSNKTLIKNGIPSGKWVSYGYDGEVVQSGNFKPVILNFEEIAGLTKIQRINICEIYEAKEHFFDIFIVSKGLKKDVDKTHDKRFLESLLHILKKQDIYLDTDKINKITAVKIELKEE